MNEWRDLNNIHLSYVKIFLVIVLKFNSTFSFSLNFLRPLIVASSSTFTFKSTNIIRLIHVKIIRRSEEQEVYRLFKFVSLGVVSVNMHYCR